MNLSQQNEHVDLGQPEGISNVSVLFADSKPCCQPQTNTSSLCKQEDQSVSLHFRDRHGTGQAFAPLQKSCQNHSSYVGIEPYPVWFSCSCKSYLVKCEHNHVSPYQLVAKSVSHKANKKSVSALCYKNPHCRQCVGGKLK